ncbi:DUF134 domain-containing protein [Candidatus Falkowbacteria bacterium]|nr:DUF134 domain-containing protein [Candidatus Falkowbacteria bacterium]
MGNGFCGGRPRLKRKIGFRHKSNFYKPQGVPLRTLEIVEMTKEELEALRLKDVKGFDQNECALKMKTSQSTFQRIISSARQKAGRALVEGKAIRIES